MQQNKLIFLCFAFLLASIQLSIAQEVDSAQDIMVRGLELEKLLNLGSGVLAVILAIVTGLAYRRTYNPRLKYVALAFSLFAIKGFITGAEIIVGDWPWVDPVASILDFGILASFFLGIMKE